MSTIHKTSRGANARTVVDYMRKNPGRHTSGEISAELPDVPFGTVSSVLSVEYADSVSHGGAGIYAFAGPGNGSLYSWCSSRPNLEDLRPIRVMGPRRPPAKRPTNRIEKLVLNATQFPGIFKHPDGHMVRLQAVTVTIEDTTTPE